MPPIKISSYTVEENRKFGIFRSAIKKVLQNPDGREELKPELTSVTPPAAWPVFTFYLKALMSRGADDGHLLVQVVEEAGKQVVTQEVTAVWRIYPSDLGLKESISPVEAFRAFVATYGVNLEMQHQSSKLFLHQIVFPSTKVENNVTTHSFAFPQNVLEASDRRVTETPQIRTRNWMKSVDHKLCLAMVYAINESNYLQDLKARGVQIKP